MKQAQHRRLLLMAATALLLGAVYLALINQAPSRPAAPQLVFSTREPTDIDRLTVKNAQGGYEISYQAEEGGYALGTVPPELIDMDRFIALMLSQAQLAANTKLTEPASDLSTYGLDQPAASCELLFSDGSQLAYHLGSKERVSGDYYLRVEGQEGVFTYPKEAALTLLSGQTGLLSLQVTPPLTLSSPLSQIKDVRFSGKGIKEPLSIYAVLGGNAHIRQQALTFGAATHLVQGRGLHELDQQGGIRVLGSLLDIRAIQVLGINLTKAQITGYGFDQPDYKAEFHLAGRSQQPEAMTLALVDAGNDSFYAHVMGRPVVYLINRPAFCDLRYEDLILRYFASPMLVDITGISIRSPEKSYQITYEKTLQGEAQAKVNGQRVDLETFYAFYRLVTSAAADGGLIDGVAEDLQPALSITYHYKSPGKADDVLVFTASSVRRMAVSVNGITELDIRESFVSRLLTACENLLAGQPIEEVW